MFGNLWASSRLTSEKLGVSEMDLSKFREYGIFKPGIHWKSSPSVQLKPWNPEAVYNLKLCMEIIKNNSFYNSNIQRAA
tara:strand:+ start:214 stop:450 length:237 start_codon:yes stop_codon:yes gene_type:complete